MGQLALYFVLTGTLSGVINWSVGIFENRCSQGAHVYLNVFYCSFPPLLFIYLIKQARCFKDRTPNDKVNSKL